MQKKNFCKRYLHFGCLRVSRTVSHLRIKLSVWIIAHVWTERHMQIVTGAYVFSKVNNMCRWSFKWTCYKVAMLQTQEKRYAR